MDSFKSYIEEQMDLKKECTIRFRNVDGAVSTFRGHIIRVDTVSGREMLETDAGLTIGFDQLLAVNERVPQNYC